MRVCLYLDPGRVFRWHSWLIEALTSVPGCEISVAFSSSSNPLPRSCSLLFELERIVYGIAGKSAMDREPALGSTRINQVKRAVADADVVVNLAGSTGALPSHRRVLTPCFNGIVGEVGAISALFNAQPLTIEVHDSACPTNFYRAQPASSDRQIVIQSLENALSCTAGLITKAVHKPAVEVTQPERLPEHVGLAALPLAAAMILHTTRAITHKVVGLLGDLARGEKKWTVAWRFDPSTSLIDKRTARFVTLKDDGRRYYADPFLFHHSGRDFLFVEEFCYATGRGSISVAEIGPSGLASTPRAVLQEPHHLSYPFVFEHGGDTWMIPESGEAGGVYLYRAEHFPDRWKCEGRLLDGVEGYDATMLQHQNRFWLFVCEKVWNSASWDILSLFHSDSPAGKWLPHVNNPVVFDATLSRPGGAFLRRDGRYVRPVQDCSRQYGGSVLLCRLDALSDTDFAQTPIGRIHGGAFGCHTYNRQSGFEVIDLFGATQGVIEVDAFFVPLPAQGALGRPVPCNATCPTNSR